MKNHWFQFKKTRNLTHRKRNYLFKPSSKDFLSKESVVTNIH